MTTPRTDARRRKRIGYDRALGRGRHPHVAAWRRTALAALVAVQALAGPAAAAGADDRAKRHVSFGVLAGSAQPVRALADYQWDVRPHAAWGAEVLAGSGPWSVGVRGWRSGTTQGLGLAGVPDPAVRTTSFELVSRARLARWRNVELEALASGGRLAVVWEPGQLLVDTGGGSPVTVTLSAVHEWVAGTGVTLGLPLGRDWKWSIETERRWYALDTAHRDGATVVLARPTFGDWDARTALTRRWDW
ncbi:MAG: hypothetical protein ABL977_04575 [Candidatus Eisenbacteria bacterium]